jgi:N-acetylmuramidase/Putative peptidoglycan binding domain
MLNPELKSIITLEAQKAGIDPAALLAVIEVESAGKFFALVNGRQEPLIRFEGHYFDRRLPDAAQQKARDAGLASPHVGKIPNPASQAARWPLLERASAFSRPAALESTSWGIGQIMGSHWKSLGYPSVEAFVETARSGAAGQVELLIRFIEKNGLLPVLNSGDWAAFARRYNGPLYRRNAYDTKLAAAYKRHRNGADWLPGKPASPVIAFGSSGDAVRDLQLTLTALGYPVKPTATFDHATKAALMRFQKASGLAADGIAGPKTAAALAARFSALPKRRNWLIRLFALIWKFIVWLAR